MIIQVASIRQVVKKSSCIFPLSLSLSPPRKSREHSLRVNGHRVTIVVIGKRKWHRHPCKGTAALRLIGKDRGGRSAVLGWLALALLRVRVLGTRVREQGVATRVNRRAERAGVLSREMNVIVIAHVRHDLTAQRAPPPLVAVTLSLKYLRYPPIFQLCNNRNHRVSECLPKMRHRVISLFLALFFFSLSLSMYIYIYISFYALFLSPIFFFR